MSERLIFAGPVEVEGRVIRGSVTLAGERTRRNGEWLEVDPAALVAADASDVKGRVDHDPSKVLGRTSNDTVRLARTDEGIAYEIDVNETSFGNDALVMARRGDFGGSSFEIEGLRYAFTTDLEDGSRVRRITHIERITDVSPVIDPAFLNSTVAAFSDKETDMPAPVTDPAKEPVKEPEAPKVALKTEPEGDTHAFEAAARNLSTADLEAVMDNIMAESKGDLTGELLNRYEAFAKVHGERTVVSAEERDRSKRMEALHNLRLGRIPKPPTEAGLFASDDYANAWLDPKRGYLRTGNPAVLEQFAQSIGGTGAEGGYTVPDGFQTKITERKKKIGGVRSVADVFSTADGTSLRWPSNDDTGNSAAIAAEGVAGAAGADLAFGNITLGAFSYSANGAGNVPLKVSLELLQDSAFDLEGFISRKLGQRIGRKQAVDLATGAGTTAPFGLFSKTPDALTATKTQAAANELESQVDAEYRVDGEGECVYVMSDTVFFLYRNAVDKNNRPLLLPEAAAGIGSRPSYSLNGYRIVIDNGAGVLVAFGDIKAGYVVRDVLGVQVLVNPYNSSGTRQVEYHAWARMDANIQDSAAYSVSDFTSVTSDAV